MNGEEKRARELANEILRPLGITTDGLTPNSQHNLERQMVKAINLGKENALYDSQKGWQKGDR